MSVTSINISCTKVPMALVYKTKGVAVKEACLFPLSPLLKQHLPWTLLPKSKELVVNKACLYPVAPRLVQHLL